MRKSVVWMPVLLVGAMVYWTLALGFGGLSLMSLTSGCEIPDPEGSVRDSYQSIHVNLGDAPQLNGEGVGSVTVDLVSDHELTRAAGIDRGGSGQGAAAQQGSSPQGDRRGGGRPARDLGPGETAF